MIDNRMSQHLEKIPAFVMVVRLGSITKASQALAISQAALSQAIQVLEDSLEVRLLIRSRNGVRPTEQGQILFQYGERLVDDITLLDAKMRNPKKQVSKQLKIGTHEALAIHLWPQIVEDFQEKHPDISLSITSGRMEALLERVRNRSLDLILTVKPKELKTLISEVVYKDTFKFFALKSSSLTKKALSYIPILTDYHSHLEQGKPLSKVLAESDLHSSYYFQLNSFQAAIRFAERGIGVALLPEKIGEEEMKRNSSIRKVAVSGIKKRIFDHTIHCSYLKDSKYSTEIQLLTSFVKKSSK